jgi:hypothetical protein
MLENGVYMCTDGDEEHEHPNVIVYSFDRASRPALACYAPGRGGKDQAEVGSMLVVPDRRKRARAGEDVAVLVSLVGYPRRSSILAKKRKSSGLYSMQGPRFPVLC